MSPARQARARFVLTAVRGAEPQTVTRHPTPGVHWRLLSRNNRQLGRSPAPFPSEGAALEGARQLVRALAALEPVRYRLESPVRWLWLASVGADPVAVSGRSYERERLAAIALDHFLAAAASAAGPGASDTWLPQPRSGSENAMVAR